MNFYKVFTWALCHICNRHDWDEHSHKKSSWQTRVCKDCGRKDRRKPSKLLKRIVREVKKVSNHAADCIEARTQDIVEIGKEVK